MAFDAFPQGVKPGGLLNRNDIKLLICYILSSIESGLSKKDIISVLQDNSLANYFESTDAFSELVENNIICCTDQENQFFSVTEAGKLIADQLEISLPVTVREQVLSATLNLLAKIKRERENTVEIKKLKNGYTVNCHVSGGLLDLMSINLYAPDIMQAKLIKHNFQKNPELVYDCVLALMTDNKDMVRKVLSENN